MISEPYSLERIPPNEVTRRLAVSHLKTLVVDDDPTSRQMLAMVLARAGHSALLASSAEEGLELFHRHAPDMVLMDIMLPGMDGCQAMQLMKEARGASWLPVILISVMDTPEEVLAGLRAGADDYLTKPIRVDQVLAKLRNTSRTLLLQTQLASALRFGQVIREHIHEAMLCCDDAGLIQTANKAAESVFGYAPGTLVGNDSGQILSDVGPKPGVRGQSDASMYGIGRKQNGELFSIEVRQTVVELDGKMLTLMTLRDVSRQLAEERRMLNDAAQLREYKSARETENALAREMLDRLIRHDTCQTRSLSYSTEAATGFSGDVVIALRSPSGRLFVVLADATGHGLAAAISLVPALAVLHAMVARECSLKQIVSELNDKMLELMPVGRFLAGAVVCLDKRARRGELWVAGVPALLLIEPDGRLKQRFESEHLAFGIVPSSAETADVTSFEWSGPCQLVLTSDGVLEAENLNGEPFGEARLLRTLRAASCSERLESVTRAVRQHLGGLPASDDASIAIVDLP